MAPIFGPVLKEILVPWKNYVKKHFMLLLFTDLFTLECIMDLTWPCFLTYLQTSHVLSTSDVYLYALRVLRFLLLSYMFPNAVPIKADVLFELKTKHFLVPYVSLCKQCSYLYCTGFLSIYISLILKLSPFFTLPVMFFFQFNLFILLALTFMNLLCNYFQIQWTE